MKYHTIKLYKLLKSKECDIACDDTDGADDAGCFVAEFKKNSRKNRSNGSEDDEVHGGSIRNGINSAAAIEEIRNGKNGEVEKAASNDVADCDIIVFDFEEGECGSGFRKGGCYAEEESTGNGFSKVESYGKFIGDIGEDYAENNNADTNDSETGKDLFSGKGNGVAVIFAFGSSARFIHYPYGENVKKDDENGSDAYVSDIEGKEAVFIADDEKTHCNNGNRNDEVDFGKFAFREFSNGGKNEEAEHCIVEKVASEDVAYAKTGLIKHKGGRNACEKFRKGSYSGKKNSAKECAGKGSGFIKHIHIFGCFDGHKGYQSGNNEIEHINHFCVSVLFCIIFRCLWLYYAIFCTFDYRKILSLNDVYCQDINNIMNYCLF